MGPPQHVLEDMSHQTMPLHDTVREKLLRGVDILNENTMAGFPSNEPNEHLTLPQQR